MVEISIPLSVKGDREARETFRKLNDEITALYEQSLNTRIPVEHVRGLTGAIHALGRELSEIAAPAMSRMGFALGGGLAAGFVASLIGVTKAARDFAHGTRVVLKDPCADRAHIAAIPKIGENVAARLKSRIVTLIHNATDHNEDGHAASKAAK
jgi:hypothetical protein